jgi:type I restriction-modification system DNA methylase subunit
VKETEINSHIVGLNKMLLDFGILEGDRPLFFASILLALTDLTFYESYQKCQDIESITNKIISIATDKILQTSTDNGSRDIEKIKLWTKLLSYVSVVTANKDAKHLKIIITKIRENIFDKTNGLTANFDILGKCYHIFLTYGKKQKAGDISLTPEHIKLIMCKIANIKYTDVVLDTCTGSGGFLIKAINIMEQDLKNNRSVFNENMEDARKKIKMAQLLGVENEPKMYALACINMKLNASGKDSIILADGLDANLMHKYFNNIEANIGIINPPYSNHQPIKFLCNLCNQIKTGGRAVIICPGNFLDVERSKPMKPTLKDLLFKKNTLIAVIKCHKQIFLNGSDTSIFVFETGRPHKFDSDEVYYYNFEDDGYKIIPKNGRIQMGDTNGLIDNIVNDFFSKTTKTKGSYSKKISINSTMAYEKEEHKTNSIVDDHKYCELCIEDFEEAIFDYFMFKNRIEELRHTSKDIKRFIIMELRNGKN